MWSAPKQPFVLPVRIRSFEELYSQNINKDKNAKPFDKSAAKSIREKANARDIALSEALKTKIKKESSIQKLKQCDNNLLGIYDGQLFVFIKQILETDAFKDEYRKEDEFKLPLLKAIFNSDDITICKGEHEKKGQVNYFCTSKENWDKLFQDK